MKHFVKILRSRRGVSLTEVIISMTAVVIVTGAAISVLFASSASDVKFSAKTRALEACDSAVECLRFANGNEEALGEALGYAGFKDEDETGEFVLKCGKGEVVSVDTRTDSVEVEKVDENGDTVTETVDTVIYVVTYNDKIIYEIEKIENDTDENE